MHLVIFTHRVVDFNRSAEKGQTSLEGARIDFVVIFGNRGRATRAQLGRCYFRSRIETLLQEQRRLQESRILLEISCHLQAQRQAGDRHGN